MPMKYHEFIDVLGNDAHLCFSFSVSHSKGSPFDFRN